MKRTQIQFPDPLFLELKQLADRLDWSLAEVVRRASENFAARFSVDGASEIAWSFPIFDDMGEYRTDPARIRPETGAIMEKMEDLK